MKPEINYRDLIHGPHSCMPVTVRLRCDSCNKMLAEVVTAPWRLKCPRCGTYAVG